MEWPTHTPYYTASTHMNVHIHCVVEWAIESFFLQTAVRHAATFRHYDSEQEYAGLVMNMRAYDMHMMVYG